MNHNTYGRSYSRLGEGVRDETYANALQHYAPRRDWATISVYAMCAVGFCVAAWALAYT